MFYFNLETTTYIYCTFQSKLLSTTYGLEYYNTQGGIIMAFDQFETLEEKIQYVLENHDKLMQQRIEKADKKLRNINQI